MFNSKMSTKYCRGCENNQSIKYFYRDKTKKDGYKNVCKTCYKKSGKSQTNTDPEHVVQQQPLFLERIAQCYRDKDTAGLLSLVQTQIDIMEAEVIAPGNTLTFHQDRIIGAVGYTQAVGVAHSKLSVLLLQKNMNCKLQIINNRTAAQYGHIYINFPGVVFTKQFISDCMDTLYGKCEAKMYHSIEVELEPGMLSVLGTLLQHTTQYVSEIHDVHVNVQACLMPNLCMNWSEMYNLRSDEYQTLQAALQGILVDHMM